ncbi:TIGR03746 family integrating conjugative element protein [Salmonella enterica subsp. enterica]|nr:TIGR03746 family integrating conjugative element protein [Salmonella enterica subsp. enterica]
MATIPFLPDRLNREPVVWRGLTTSELFLALASGLGGGCAFGILLALITHYWPLIPGSALAGAALLIQGGGRILARAKRGKPDSWLPQAILSWLERHHLRGTPSPAQHRVGGAQESAMSRFRHALAERDNHILTLRAVIVLLCLCLAGVGYGWYSAPQKLTLWFPPDLRSGSTRPWWEVPPASVYAFTFYIFQQLNRWPDNGEEDYSRNLRSQRAYLTPACYTRLEHDFQVRRNNGELRERTRGVYELPGHSYSNLVHDGDKRPVRPVTSRHYNEPDGGGVSAGQTGATHQPPFRPGDWRQYRFGIHPPRLPRSAQLSERRP